MKRNKLLVFSLLITLCAALVILPVSAATNLCTGATILGAESAESGVTYTDAEHDFCQTVNAGAEGPQFFIDDDPGYATKWCATDGGNHPDEPHWLIIDFGAEKTFDSLQMVKASEGERDFGQPQYDAAAYTFSVSSDKTNWTVFCQETENTDPIYKKSFDATTGRYVKITFEAPEADVANMAGAVRIYDIAIYEAAGATPAEETTTAPAEVAPVEETTAPAEVTPVEEITAPTTQAPVVNNPVIPKTGDATVLYVMLIVASVAAVAVTLKVKKDRA